MQDDKKWSDWEYWKDVGVLKWQDLEKAMEFLDVLGFLVIQVQSSKDLPYVRRWLYQNMGEPRRVVGDMFYYGDNRVAIRTLDRCEGYSPGVLFFVGREHDDKTGMEHLDKRRPWMPMYLFWENQLTLADLRNLMTEDLGSSYAAELELGYMEYAGVL